MSDITVKQLAEDVGIPVELLLTQLKQAKLDKSGAEDVITEAEKLQLLTHLRESHGKKASNASGTPRKITLKRKTVTELKQPGSTVRAPGRGSVNRGGKTVSVEVRKKRTYIKRSSITDDDKSRLEAEAAQKALEEQAEQRRLVEAENQARQAAEAKRRETEEALKLAAQEEEKKKREAEEQKRLEAERMQSEQEQLELRRQEEAVARLKVEQESKHAPKERVGKKSTRRDAEDEGDEPRGRGRKELHVSEDKRGRRRGKPVRQKAVAPIPDTQHGFVKPTAPVVREVEIPETISVADLAQRMTVKAADVIKGLIKMGMMVTINQQLDSDTATLVVEELGHKAVPQKTADIEAEVMSSLEDEVQGETKPRAPAVTIMGHVD
ncbi:MAG: translation initiation factor IF-2 N-terminal domain-containing protein, partial [Gammaproteobacteria bacterium]|nr:translation initiation factor IF-2 N-terminal domain-containing protein [Gammaproteobacteria bacterium]